MLNKTALWLFLLTAGLPTLCNGQDSLLLKISEGQLSTINGTREYAVGCKAIKDTLFIALDDALSLISDQKKQIAAQDSAKAKCDTKYQLLQEDEAALKKQVKKEKSRRTGNAILFYVSVGVNVGLAVLYLAK